MSETLMQWTPGSGWTKLKYATGGKWPGAKARNQWAILEALLRGERLTVAVALEKYQVYALSQECGRLRKLGWTIHSERVELNSQKNVSQYWMTV